jgi:hypothetical protein
VVETFKPFWLAFIDADCVAASDYRCGTSHCMKITYQGVDALSRQNAALMSGAEAFEAILRSRCAPILESEISSAGNLIVL